MKVWQVQIWGEGFIRNGRESSFEMSGIVEAQNLDAAFAAAVSLAKAQHPELVQAEHPSGPGAVINAEEIEEFPGAPASQIGKTEVFWSSHSGGA